MKTHLLVLTWLIINAWKHLWKKCLFISEKLISATDVSIHAASICDPQLLNGKNRIINKIEDYIVYASLP